MTGFPVCLAPPFQSSPYSFHEWRNAKTTNSQSSSAARQRANPLSDLGLSDDDWDRPPLGGYERAKTSCDFSRLLSNDQMKDFSNVSVSVNDRE